VLLALLLAGAWARLAWQAEALLLEGVPGRPLWLTVQATLGLTCVAVVLWLPARGSHTPESRDLPPGTVKKLS
jgi:hypothetical protein